MKHVGNLTYSDGAKKKVKRIGRGQGSGHGGTSTQGHKGQKSRSGATVRRGFEGGQMPLHRRLPKFGFTNIHRIEFQIVNLSRLQELVNENALENGGVVNFETLYGLGVINHSNLPLKVLGNGEITAKLNIEADSFSKSAISKIEAAGGTAKVNG